MTAIEMTLVSGAALASVVSFGMMGLDKSRARRGGQRIPEKVLLLWSLLFGAVGGWFGMRVFRHKTQKPKFYITMPLLMLLQIAALILILRR